MDILNSLNQTLYPGYRVPRVKGYEGAKAYFVPRDCEAMMIDEDPNKNIMYMKKVDNNGVESVGWYDYKERPIPEYDPEKFVTKDELKNLKEDLVNEVINAINTNRQSTATIGNARKKQSDKCNEQHYQSDFGFSESATNV